MSDPIVVPVYTCKVVITDDRYPGGRTTEADDCSLTPFELGETTSAGGRCRCVRSGSPEPAYRLEVAGGGELFRTAPNDYHPEGVLLARFPKKEAGKWEVADARTLLIMARQRDRVRSLGVYAEGTEPTPVPAQVHGCKPERRPLVVMFGPAPTGPPEKLTQLGFFEDEMEVAG